MKRVFFVLITFAFILTNYGEVEAYTITKKRVKGEVIKIENHPRLLVMRFKTMPQENKFATKTITLRTEKEDITKPVIEEVWDYDIKIGDILSVVYIESDEPIDDKTTVRHSFINEIERIRTAAEEKAIIASIKLRIASEAKAQIPKAITLAKLGQIEEAMDIYLSIPEWALTQDNILLWNERCALFQALEPYVREHKSNAKSLNAKGQYREALNEYAEALKAADDAEAEEIRRTALEIIRRNPSLSELTEDARKYAVRGDVLVKQGNFEGAVKEYRKAIQKAPFVAKLYYNTALIYGELKKYPVAIRYMKTYLQVAPDAPDARAAKDEIYKWELQMEKAGKAGGQ